SFRVTLVDPVLAGGAAGDPNALVSLPYLPGSLFRGAAIGAAIAAHGPLDAADAATRALFFDGAAAARFLNAYPAPGSGSGRAIPGSPGHRALPTPRAWVRRSLAPPTPPPDEILDEAHPTPLTPNALYDPVVEPFVLR